MSHAIRETTRMKTCANHPNRRGTWRCRPAAQGYETAPDVALCDACATPNISSTTPLRINGIPYLVYGPISRRANARTKARRK